jgi:hypothetical protein
MKEKIHCQSPPHPIALVCLPLERASDSHMNETHHRDIIMIFDDECFHKKIRRSSIDDPE